MTAESVDLQCARIELEKASRIRDQLFGEWKRLESTGDATCTQDIERAKLLYLNADSDVKEWTIKVAALERQPVTK